MFSWYTVSLLCVKENTNNVKKHVFRFPVTMEGFWKIQLFRGRLSEKVNATIPKGIVGGFEFTVLQRNLKKWQERPWTCV